MGLLDVLNGMQNGPRGPSTPSAKNDRRRDVAHDDGDHGAAGLEGDEAFRRRPAGRCADAGARQNCPAT